jgi:hypothetical protein
VLTATAVVVTDSSTRYAKQLVSHLGHKVSITALAGEPPAWRFVFAYGVGVVRATEGRLLLDAEAPDPEALARVQDVLGRHLQRFGQRGGLTVAWLPAQPPETGTPPPD